MRNSIFVKLFQSTIGIVAFYYIEVSLEKLSKALSWIVQLTVLNVWNDLYTIHSMMTKNKKESKWWIKLRNISYFVVNLKLKLLKINRWLFAIISEFSTIIINSFHKEAHLAHNAEKLKKKKKPEDFYAQYIFRVIMCVCVCLYMYVRACAIELDNRVL